VGKTAQVYGCVRRRYGSRRWVVFGQVFGIDGILVLLIPLASLVVAVWALVDAAIRPGPAFEAAGQSKVLWIVLPIVGMFLFAIIGGVLGVVYLASIRPKVRRAQSGRY
jgi:Protein of unknown function (DUF2516)